MAHKFVLSKANDTFEINIKNEYDYLKITRIVIPSIQNDRDIATKLLNISISYKIKNFQQKSFLENPLCYLNSLVGPYTINADFVIDRKLFEKTSSKDDIIIFYLENDSENDYEIEVYYEFYDLINNEDPDNDFTIHISDYQNAKILFSAPFGHGKTTFLNNYFDKRKQQFEVFYLYPVNYSICTNEDIFQYIKCEILFQLLGKDVEFDKENFSYFQTVPQFALNNAHNIFAPFIKLLPKIGRSAYEIYEKLFELGKEYFNHHENLQIDDEKEAIAFIESCYSKEGSIYEDNFYTQLIRQLVEQIKIKGKETVLVIDDIDRMDPEHIFRILNVFSAHFDNKGFEALGISNKFNFDKIIIVCDYSNLRKIFSHKYGTQTDFCGYIDKFYSKQLFEYNNKKVISTICKQILNIDSGNLQLSIFCGILNDLILTNNLSLREILKIQKQDFNLFVNGIPKYSNNNVNVKRGGDIKKYYHIKFPYFLQLYYLNMLADMGSIINKLKNCHDYLNGNLNFPNKKLFDYSLATLNGFIPLAVNSAFFDEDAVYSYSFNEYILSFRIKCPFPNEPTEAYEIYTESLNPPTIPKFKEKDFYEILIRVAEKYREVGGLLGTNLQKN